MPRLRIALGLALLPAAALALAPAAALADATVTLCATDVQAGAGVDLFGALTVGGRIVFACGGSATIKITRDHALTRDTTIEGSGHVTLDAGLSSGMFSAPAGVKVTLSGMTLTGGRRPPCAICAPNWGGVLRGEGTFSILGTTITHSTSPVVATGAAVTVRDSTFTDNAGSAIVAEHGVTLSNTRIGYTDGPAILATGDAVVENAEIFGNRASRFDGCDSLIVRGARFTNDSAAADQGPGALSVNCANATIDHSRFTNNKGKTGGAVYFDQKVVRIDMNAVQFEGNQSEGDGGAIAFGYNNAVPRGILIHHATFKNNQASSGGAIDLGESIENDTVLTGSAVTFSRNEAAKTGGAISGANASVVLARAIFADNVAGQSGGGIFLRVFGQRPTDVLANALFVRNTAPSGSAFAGANADFFNSTLAANIGRAIEFVAPFPAAWRRITLKNSIVAQNRPDNCQPGTTTYGIEDRGNNIQFPDATCGASVLVTDPMLDTMFIPIVGSPAMGGGEMATCRAAPVDGRDVLGQPRPQGKDCTIGAMEGDIEYLVNSRLARHHEPLPGGPP